MISLLCCAMRCFAQLYFCMPCFAMLCLAQLAMPLQCYDLLCYAWLCFAMLCFCMTSPCFAVLSFVQLCSALLCLAMLGSALLCLAKVMLRLRMLCWCCSRHCKNSGTHESGLVRHYKNNGFLEPDYCIPAVCSRKFSCLIPIANSSTKYSFEVPLWGGPQPGPKNEKLHKENDWNP